MKKYIFAIGAILFFSCYSVYSKDRKPDKEDKTDVTNLSAPPDDGAKFDFLDALDYYTAEYYNEALPIFMRLLQRDVNNANLNFLVGECYFKSMKKKSQAIPYLEKAIKSTTLTYTYTFKETSAPVFAFYFLGMAYHCMGRFDDAIEQLKKFKEQLDVRKDAIYVKDAERQIEICQNAKEFTKKPAKNVKITLVDVTNSPFSDYGSVITPDGKTLYFSTRRKGNMGGEEDPRGGYFEDIYFTELKGNAWTKPKRAQAKVFNTSSVDVISSISANGNTILMYRMNRGSKYDIFITEVTGKVTKSSKKKFTTTMKLGPNINTKDNETNACISPDGLTLYFVSDMPGGYGGTDIYMSEKLKNGEWARPFNLGPEINTPYNEDCPVILPDGVTLYFSSKGHNTIGGFDIFISTLSEEGFWSKPENLGCPINTPFDDTNFMYTADERRAYYSSAKEGGSGVQGIYEIQMLDKR